MDKNLKFINGSVREFSKDVEETRTVEFIISTDAKDRHGTSLNMNNWNLDNFNKNGIVGYQHNVYGGDMCNPPNPDDVIGKGEAFIENGMLIGRVTFEPAEINPLAEKIFRKVLHGSLKATSVGFLPILDDQGREGRMGDESLGENKDTFYYFGQELLEFSIVNIPSNPEALRRGLADQAANALMFLRRNLNKNFAEIENMTVREIIDELQGTKKGDLELKQKSLNIKSKSL